MKGGPNERSADPAAKWQRKLLKLKRSGKKPKAALFFFLRSHGCPPPGRDAGL